METWVARPAATRSRLANIDLRHRIFAALVAVAFLLAAQPFVASADASAGSISGVAFHDANHDGVRQGDEDPFIDHLIDVFDEDGNWVAARRTDQDGYFSVSSLPAGTYTVRYALTDWRDLWEDWVPTTTGSLEPVQQVTVAGAEVTADFGWRQVERSTDVNEPLSEVRGPDGLRVRSYVDVVTAQEIYDHIISKFLVGDEAGSTNVRFGYGTRGAASTTVSYDYDEDGERIVTAVHTTVSAPLGSWVYRGDRTLAHEYGHAWANYHNYYGLQDVDREWGEYLEARDIDPDDDRLGTSHSWFPTEIAAEDYRILFTSENAASAPHMNRDIPHLGDVDGFETWLRDEFGSLSTSGDGGGSSADGTDDADTEGSSDDEDDGTEDEPHSTDEDAEDSSESDDEAEESTSSLDDGDVKLSVETHKVRGINHADLSWKANDSAHVDIYRNGERITTTNGSTFTDDTGSRGSPTYTYQVCGAGTDVCSEEIEVRF